MNLLEKLGKAHHLLNNLEDQSEEVEAIKQEITDAVHLVIRGDTVLAEALFILIREKIDAIVVHDMDLSIRPTKKP
jgi:hypothetical protein